MRSDFLKKRGCFTKRQPQKITKPGSCTESGFGVLFGCEIKQNAGRVCQTYDRKGKAACLSKTIPEIKLKAVCAGILGLREFDETVFSEKVEQITVIGDDTLEFHFTDGTMQQKK